MSVQVLTPKSEHEPIQSKSILNLPVWLEGPSVPSALQVSQSTSITTCIFHPDSLPTPHTSLHTNTFPWDDQETELSPVAAKCMRQWQRQKLRKFEAPTAGALLICHWLSLLCYFTVEETTTYSVSASYWIHPNHPTQCVHWKIFTWVLAFVLEYHSCYIKRIWPTANKITHSKRGRKQMSN